MIGDVGTYTIRQLAQHYVAVRELVPSVRLDAGAVSLEPLELPGLGKLVATISGSRTR